MSDESDFALPGFDAPAPPAAAPAYRVLARKYRPASFDALLGQEAMVQTLANAIARERLAQAWLLTGVRGVGKTSTARIIAKALNCIGADGQGGPTIAPCGICDPCTAIAEGRHIDGIEMDAASNTGIDDIREIIEAVRSAPASARYKIYIIDEVHMLSKNAFNGLLKTLEEPPPHAKFIFATTEVQKVPVTVLSRCQRFDLRRVPADLLVAHFADIVRKEGAEAEPEALALIARAAEGSVRDGLSILDQAIAHSGGMVTAPAIRDMLGLADRGAVRALFGQMLAGEAAAVLASVAEQYDLGRDPEMLLRELLELVHAITRQRMAPRPDPALSAEEQATLKDWAERLTFPALHRLWQLLLKGLAEVQAAPVPLQAAEMALLRVIHAADLPDPGDLVRRLRDGDGSISGGLPTPDPSRVREGGRSEAFATAPPSRMREELGVGTNPPVNAQAPQQATPAPLPATFEALVALFRDHVEPRLAHVLSDELRLIDYAPPRMIIAHDGRTSAEHRGAIGRRLKDWTGSDWQIDWRTEGGGATLREAELAAEAARFAAARADPLVEALFGQFPDAELIGVDPTPVSEKLHAQSR